MTQDQQQLERFQNKAKIEKAKARAMGMKVTELAFTAGGAALSKVIEVKTGRTTVGSSGALAKISWDALFIVAGLGGVFFARGFVQDAASGILNAGLVKVASAMTEKALAPA